MSYVAKVLQPGETVTAVGRLHWIVYRKAIAALVLALVLFAVAKTTPGLTRNTAGTINIIGLVVVFFAVWLALNAWFDRWITEIAVTSRRVIYKRGFIKRYTAEMNMDKVESVVVTQSILGRVLGYGTIHVRGTGEGIEHLHDIRAPLALRNCIIAG
jgi:uncharacterized membrane protein YdbT with pleckstrin-like domain